MSDLRKKLAKVINDCGGEPGSSLHSWRCEDKERYPEECLCVAYVVDEMLPIIEQHYAEKMKRAHGLSTAFGYDLAKSEMEPPPGWTERVERRNVTADGNPLPSTGRPRGAVRLVCRVWTEPWREEG